MHARRACGSEPNDSLHYPRGGFLKGAPFPIRSCIVTCGEPPLECAKPGDAVAGFHQAKMVGIAQRGQAPLWRRPRWDRCWRGATLDGDMPRRGVLAVRPRLCRSFGQRRSGHTHPTAAPQRGATPKPGVAQRNPGNAALSQGPPDIIGVATSLSRVARRAVVGFEGRLVAASLRNKVLKARSGRCPRGQRRSSLPMGRSG